VCVADTVGSQVRVDIYYNHNNLLSASRGHCTVGSKVITTAQPAEGAEDTEIMAAPAQAAAGAAAVGSLEALQQQVEGVNAAILKVEEELGEVKDEVREVKKALESGALYRGMVGERLQDHLRALMKEKEQLRKKEEQLRDEKAKLMDRQATAGEQPRLRPCDARHLRHSSHMHVSGTIALANSCVLRRSGIVVAPTVKQPQCTLSAFTQLPCLRSVSPLHVSAALYPSLTRAGTAPSASI
jgi:hypothetical protein